VGLSEWAKATDVKLVVLVQLPWNSEGLSTCSEVDTDEKISRHTREGVLRSRRGSSRRSIETLLGLNLGKEKKYEEI
jgi:hypothetical protein